MKGKKIKYAILKRVQMSQVVNISPHSKICDIKYEKNIQKIMCF